MVPFNDTDSLEEVAARALSQRSMLTEYFKMNIEDPKAHQYLYREFPEHYIWVKSGKYWKPRKQRFQIGRLVYANPAEGCMYYLRILLNHVRGVTSYESLYVLLLETIVRSSGLLPVMGRLMKQCLKHHISKCRVH
jgi:hypothetical protein